MAISLTTLDTFLDLYVKSDHVDRRLELFLDELGSENILELLEKSFQCINNEVFSLFLEIIVPQTQKIEEVYKNFKTIQENEAALGSYNTHLRPSTLPFLKFLPSYKREVTQIRQSLDRVVNLAFVRMHEANVRLAEAHQLFVDNARQLSPREMTAILFLQNVYDYFVDLAHRVYCFVRHHLGYFEISYCQVSLDHYKQPVEFYVKALDPGNVNLEERYKALYSHVEQEIPDQIFDGSYALPKSEISTVWDFLSDLDHLQPDAIQDKREFKSKFHEVALVLEAHKSDVEVFKRELRTIFITLIPVLKHCADRLSTTLEKFFFKHVIQDPVKIEQLMKKKSLKNQFLFFALILRRTVFHEIFDGLDDGTLDVASTERHFMSEFNEEFNLYFSDLVNLEVNSDRWAKKNLEATIRVEFHKKNNAARMVEHFNRLIMELPDEGISDDLMKERKAHISYKRVQKWLKLNFNLEPQDFLNEDQSLIKSEVLVRMLQRFGVLI